MEIATKTDGALKVDLPQQKDDNSASATRAVASSGKQQQQQQKTKRKHRRGKPKAKNANKPYKKTNWKFQVPRLNYNNGGGANNGGANNRNRKLIRSRSLVPYNTNKFLMEEHLADVPSALLLTPSGRTRDSSFSVDSEDNYFFSLPEDEEEFLTKEFANVYEKARVERLENLTKQQLIEECLQIEDRYSTDQGTQRRQQLNVQRISAEFMTKIRLLEEKVKELSRENHNIRCQLMRSAVLAAAAAASPPSAAAPTGAACEPTPMDSSSEDSESDSSSSSSSSSSSNGAGRVAGLVEPIVAEDGVNNAGPRPHLRSRSCSSSSLSEYAYIENNFNAEEKVNNGEDDDVIGVDCERQQLLEARMDEDSNQSNGEVLAQNGFHIDTHPLADSGLANAAMITPPPTSRNELESSPSASGSMCN